MVMLWRFKIFLQPLLFCILHVVYHKLQRLFWIAAFSISSAECQSARFYR